MVSRTALHGALAERLGSVAEARWLIDEVLSARGGGGELSDADVRTVLDLTARRLGGEPLQYVLGSWAFRTLELHVDRRALIPRPETEQVVEIAIRALRAQDPGQPGQSKIVADLGTGTGAIGLSIAAEMGEGPGLVVYAVDDDPGALALAEENVERVARTHPWVARAVRLCEGSWFGPIPEELKGALSLVVSNPPYVASEEWSGLDDQVHCEPAHALVAARGSDGTPGFADVEAVVTEAFEWLGPDGSLVVELAPRQATTAHALARGIGYRDVRVERDLAGRERALFARR